MTNDTRILSTFSTLAIALLLPACMKPQQDAPASRDTLIHSAIPSTVIVVLAEQPDPKSNILTLQDYHRDGQAFIPVFRSKQSFQQSTRGTVDKPIYEIDRTLFVSILRGPETVILDLTLPDEIVTSGKELKRVFPEPFDPSRRTPSK
jgi:hypothetical protein